MKHASIALAAAAFVALLGASASAQTIVDEWASVKPEAAPVLKSASINPKTTVLLVMDLVKQSCNSDRRPRCVASVPKVKALIAAAKAKGVTVMWTLPPGPKPEDFLPDVAPPAGTAFVIAPADKFIGTDLEKTLKDKGINTIIAVGTAAHGAGLYTSSDAALRGFNVVVPLDGISAENLFAEQAVAWILANAPTISQKVTLTRMDMITYQ